MVSTLAAFLFIASMVAAFSKHTMTHGVRLVSCCAVETFCDYNVMMKSIAVTRVLLLSCFQRYSFERAILRCSRFAVIIESPVPFLVQGVVFFVVAMLCAFVSLTYGAGPHTRDARAEAKAISAAKSRAIGANDKTPLLASASEDSSSASSALGESTNGHANANGHANGNAHSNGNGKTIVSIGESASTNLLPSPSQIGVRARNHRACVALVGPWLQCGCFRVAKPVSLSLWLLRFPPHCSLLIAHC